MHPPLAHQLNLQATAQTVNLRMMRSNLQHFNGTEPGTLGQSLSVAHGLQPVMLSPWSLNVLQDCAPQHSLSPVHAVVEA